MCNKGRDITEYTYNDNHGDAQVLVYQLFPGVEVAYITVHMADFDFNLFAEEKSNKCITIHFCKEGRIEQEVDQEFFYLMPGDCSFAIQNREKNLFHLPLSIITELV